MDTPIGEDEDTNIASTLKDERAMMPDKEIEKLELNRTVREALSKLDPREEAVLRRYYGLDDGIPHTLEEVGESFGLTRERIRQILEMGKYKLKNSAEELKEYAK